MTTKIKPDYQPGPRVYELLLTRYPELRTVESAREYVGHELDAFKMYFEETGKAKASWDTTCLNWMKRSYENAKERMAKDRRYAGPSQSNIFDKVLDKLETPQEAAPITPKRPVYVHPVQPQPQETISESEALEWLANFGRKSHG